MATDEEAIHIVIWDGAGFHQKPLASDVPSHAQLVAIAALLSRVESDGETLGYSQGSYREQSL